MVKLVPSKIEFTNEVINKKKLQKLMYFTFHNYGVIKSSLIADKVKNLTFHYATISGISLSVEDLRVPYTKRTLIGMTTNEVALTEQNYNTGNITTVERFQKIIDIWNNANNSLKDEVLTYFRESDPLNPLYIMAFSGARGNISQVRQLVGMRGLMADPQGQIIDLPIQSNFREGLKVTEYIISSYGARKGLVDTALRTADSGYLTRRLVDVAQDIIVREEDCLTPEGLSLDDLFNTYKTDSSYKDRLIGRLLLKPIRLDEANISWPINTEIDNSILQKILAFKIDNVEVRSPLTCNSFRSICRKCYGWHLSYSKLIDLGEAVGILAAQSIGEPGTQLTMRTFHTGGVFSGDSTKQIRSPFAGEIRYKLTNSANIVRTIHGERGFQLLEAIKLIIETPNKTLCSLDIPKGALLLANNGQRVYRNQAISEIKKEANLILEEDRKDIYTEVSGETFFQNIKVEENVDGDGAIKKISKTNGLIWILYGNRYVLQPNSDLAIKIGNNFSPNDTVASQKLFNKFSGVVNYDNLAENGEIRVLTTSMILENGIVKESLNKDTLQLKTPEGKKTFQLYAKPNTTLEHGQKLASLIDKTYDTETGGILYYSTDQIRFRKKRTAKKIFTGSLYWIPEETHKLNSININDIKVKNGAYVKKNTQLLPSIYAGIEGIAYINELDFELIIKPGELYRLDSLQHTPEEKYNRFVQPGESLFQCSKNEIKVQKLTYLEFLTINQIEYAILRPVIRYKVPQEKGFFMEHKFFPNDCTRGVAFQTVKRIFYKDGERVRRSGGGVTLLQTFLVLDIKIKYASLLAKIQYLNQDKGEFSKLKIVLYEVIKTNENSFKDLNSQNKIFLTTLIKNNQYVPKNTILAKSDLLFNEGGTLIRSNKINNTLEILILREQNIKKFAYNQTSENLLVKQGDLVRVGTYLTTKTRSKYAGQVYLIEKNTVYLRLGRPYLISEGTVLRVGPKSLVERSDMLATLVYEKLKTVDIVQGLPKVEEILEARKIKNGCILAPHEGKAFIKDSKIEITKPTGETLSILLEAKIKPNFRNGTYVKFLEPLTDGPISPHEKLETLFNYYVLTNSVHIACKKSFKHLQLFLVNEVQKTYFSQGVQIADKHIEVIIKQMTSKVRVFASGDTTLLPGEILDINQAEMLTSAAINAGEDPPLYKPLLLGLTKASLNSDSFISAASFQETTRVLTEAAIEGKRDWLYGLKENVIIGRLIPAGTGFNCFANLKKVGKESSLRLSMRPTKGKTVKSFALEARIE